MRDNASELAKAAFENNRLAGLSPAKRALLESRLKRAPSAPKEESIPKRTGNNHVPLSSTQELLWLVDRLTPNSVNYTVPRAMRILGDLNVQALAKTFNTVVNRHEVLRTTINVFDGKPLQVIHENPTVDLPILDLSHYRGSEQEIETQRLLVTLARRPFDLSRDLLLRSTLLRLSDREHILLLETHHIASDGWSKTVLFEEFAVLYEAFCKNLPSPLPELPIQYADFALWQKERMHDAFLEKQLAYWKRQLAGAPALLELPTAHPRPAVQTFRGGGKRFDFPKSLLEGVNRLSREEATTLFITLLAAFSALLSRITKQQDIVLGTPIAGRNHPQLEGLIGYFTNTLALRTDLSGNPTFRELMRRVRATALSAYEHQDLPYERLVAELNPERNLSHSPVFQVLFSVGHFAAAVPELFDLKISPMMIDRGTSRFDLTIGMTAIPDGLAVGCEYSTDLFDEDSITRLMEQFRTLLEGVVADPEQRLSELPVLPDTERHCLLVEWNNTRSVFPKTQCIHHLIEAQVEQSPEAIAVVFGDGHLTYRELNARANQLAHYLRQGGVGPEVIVGICMERSLELAVALLAVLKAGGAYLPLDPAYPKDRLRFLTKDSRATVVLIQQRFRDLWLAEGVRAICLDSDWSEISRQSVANPGVEISSDNLAYVIYTSGSTGAPKGVVVRHRGLVNHNLAVAKLYGLQPLDRVLQFASISFDIAVEEIFPTWITGGRVVFRPEDIALSGKDFLGWIEQAQISVMDLPTAYWHEWVEQISRLGKQLPKPLRMVIVGGEKAQSSVFSTWRKIGGRRVQWFNTYGPTETTVVATAYSAACSDDTQAEIGDVPIGRPIFNTQIYLLDEHLQPVPVGVPGELCIAGEGVARGYLNRPDATAEKFVPNPFCQEPGGLMYRSGDVARYRRDGNLEFLGRCDDQVKIRGFRVETGEVETAMMQHANVQQAVVVVDEHKPGEKRLIAYLVLKEPVANPEKEVRAFLKDKLPGYMIPSVYMLLDVLPLSVNGKIDRRLLPAVSTARTEFTEVIETADDPLEQQLKQVFETVLNIRPIGAGDSFFELGGHSLLAVRLIEQMEKVVGKPIPLATLIQAPSVKQLANTLRQEGWNPGWSSLVPIQPRGSKPPIFFAHAVGGNVLNYQALPHYLGSDQPIYGLQSQGLDGKHPPSTRVEDMASHYLKEIRSLQPQGPYYLGGMSFGGMVAYEMAQQLVADGQAVALLAMLDVKGWGYTKMLSKMELVKLILVYWSSRIRLNLSSLLKLSSQDRLNYLRGKIRTIKRRNNSRQWQDAYLREVNNVHLRTPTLQNVKEANYLAAKTYNPKPYPGHVTVFRATDRLLLHTIAPEVTWKHLALGGVTVHDVPGGHLSMLDEPHVRWFAEKLNVCLQHPGKCLLFLLSASNLSPAERLLSLI